MFRKILVQAFRRTYTHHILRNRPTPSIKKLPFLPNKWTSSKCLCTKEADPEVSVSLSFINVTVSDPLKFFDAWFNEALKGPSGERARAMAVSTASKEGVPTSRTMMLSHVENDGVLIYTNQHSRLVKNLNENPHISALFCWKGDNWRQVSFMGKAEQMDDCYIELYKQKAPVHEKVQSMLCSRGNCVDWYVLKMRLDSLLCNINQKTLELGVPENSIKCYKIKPFYVEFLQAGPNEIADRVGFTKVDDSWSYVHYEA